MDAERFPSGQRGQTVNLLAMPSEVRILPSPPGPPVDHRRNQFKTVVHCPVLAAMNDKDERVVLQIGDGENRIKKRFLRNDNIGDTSLEAGVAQLAEHQPSKLRVAGSIPVSRSMNFRFF